MNKKRFLPIISFILLCQTTFASPIPALNGEGVILIEPTTNTVLVGKNKDSQFYPASTTKILTALQIINDLDLDDVVTKTQTAVNNVPSDSSQVGLNVGDTYTVEEGLYAVLLASDNFVCYDLALKDAGSINAFSDKLNSLAKSLGAVSSHFVNPHGYHNADHYTTPFDLAQIARGAFSNPILSKISGTSTHSMLVNNVGSKAAKSAARTIDLAHTALLLHKDSPYYNANVTSVKTGFHDSAKRVLVAKAHYDNIDLIGVVMKTDAPLQFEDMNALFEYGSQNFSLSTGEDGTAVVDNHSYSGWAESYVKFALDKGWITASERNYQSPSTKRELMTLLHSAFPEEALSLLEGTIDYDGSSIYKENLKLTRIEAAKSIYQILDKMGLTQLLPVTTDGIDDIAQLSENDQKIAAFCSQIGILPAADGHFYPDYTLTYEQVLRIVCRMYSMLNNYTSYNIIPTSVS